MFLTLQKLAPSWRWQSFTNNLTSSHRLGWLAGSTLVLWMASSSSPALVQTPVVTELVNETFRDPTVFGWNVGNQSQQRPTDPCLTAGNATTPSNSIGACGGTSDPSGSGALRLTLDEQDQATFAFYNYAIPSANGLQITFNFFSYGGTREIDGSKGDGLTFFLFNGATPNNQARPGAFGSSLAYAQKLGRENGLANAYVGIGFDEFGGFANDTEGRGSGSPAANNCQGYPAAAPGTEFDSVTLRGSGNGQTGYCFLQNIGPVVPEPGNPNGIDNPTVPPTGPREAAVRTARITITPDQFITVEVNFGNGFQVVVPRTNLSSFPAQDPLPPSFKFGFAAATGDATNIHEIRNLRIRTLTQTQAADMTLQNQQTSSSFIRGKTGQYRLTVTNVGNGSTYGPVAVTNRLPPGFSLASATGAGWNCSETPPGTITCVYTGDPFSTNRATDPAISPGETQTVSLTLKASNRPGTYTNTATISTTGDTNPNNNRVQTRIQVLNSTPPPPLCNRVGNVCQFKSSTD